MMSKTKRTIYLVLAAIILSTISLPAAGTEYVYSEWSAWQTDPVTASDTVEVETRTVDVTGTKTQYTYEYWRYWNASLSKYMYKGNGNLGGNHYSVTLDYKLKYYKDTSDGASYIVGNGQYIYFKGECWFNQKEIKTTVVTGQRTEYRYRTKTSAEGPLVIQTPPPASPALTPSPSAPTQSSNIPEAPVVSLSKSSYSTCEDIMLTWTTSQNAVRYGLIIRKEPYTGDANIVCSINSLKNNSVNIGKLPAGKYQLAMCGYNSSGVGGNMSNIVNFSVGEFGSPNIKLEKVKYLSSDKINMNWDPVPGAVKYIIHIKGGIIDASATNVTDTKYWCILNQPGLYEISGMSDTGNACSADSTTVAVTLVDAMINPQNLTLVSGSSVQISVSYAELYSGSRKPVLASGNKNVADVDSNGKVVAKGEGTASISISADGKKMDSCIIKVIKSPVSPVGGKTWTSRISQNYSSDHDGIDITGSKGENLYATENGIIVYKGYTTSKYGDVNGNCLIIYSDRGYLIYYGHCSSLNENLGVGSRVNPGDVIAYMGNTGKVLTQDKNGKWVKPGTNGTSPDRGVHVHFEVKKAKQSTDYYLNNFEKYYKVSKVNPAKYLNNTL